MRNFLIALMICCTAGADDWLGTLHVGGTYPSTSGYAAGNTTISAASGIQSGDNIDTDGVIIAGSGNLTLTDPTGYLLAAAGGTGITSYTVGDLLYAGTTTTLAKLAAVASGQVLVSAGTGTAPAWSGGPTLGSITLDTGNLTIGANARATSTIATFNAASGQVRGFEFYTGGVGRWSLRAGTTAETGSDSGSPFQIIARNDSGTAIDTPISIVRATGGAVTIPRPLSLTGNVTSGDASTDTHTFTGRIIPRTVTDSGMASTAGSARESLVFNSSDSRWYASIAGGSPATDWGYFLRSADATQVLSNGSGLTFDLKDSNSTSGTHWIRGLGTSGGSDTYGAAIRMNAGTIGFYTDSTPTNTSNNLTLRMTIDSSTNAFKIGGSDAQGALEVSRDDNTSGYYPGYLQLEADDGDDAFIWLTDGQQLRKHTAAPTADTDGFPVTPWREFLSALLSDAVTAGGDTSTAYTAKTADISDTIDTYVGWSIAFPADYAGQNLKWRVYYSVETNGAAGEEIALQLVADSVASAGSFAGGVTSVGTNYLDVSAHVTDTVYVSEFTGAAGGTPAAGELLFFQLRRLSISDARDDYGADLRVIGVEVSAP